ncbi:hypothetical protein ACW4TU_22040 [Streptomyces sp. QTS52]
MSRIVSTPLMSRPVAAQASAASRSARAGPGASARSALQLRQERLFALDGRLGGLARRSLYRVVDRNRTLQQKVLARAYFQVQEPGRTVARRVVRQPARP